MSEPRHGKIQVPLIISHVCNFSPTPACVTDGKLSVYYGGADKVCCLAVVELNAFLEHILNGTINN